MFKKVKISENGGLGPALKKVLEVCSNEFVARMDSDDYSLPNRIEKQLKMFDNDSSLGIVGSNVEKFENDIKNINCSAILPEYHEEIYNYSKKDAHFIILHYCIEVLSAGNYRNYYLCEDYDLYVRMLINGCKCYNIQTP